MPTYRFVYRNKKRNEGDPVFDFPDDRTAEEEGRKALADLLRDVVLDGSAIEEEAIDVVDANGRVVARVSSADDRNG
jgi:hypothetical protein